MDGRGRGNRALGSPGGEYGQQGGGGGEASGECAGGGRRSRQRTWRVSSRLSGVCWPVHMVDVLVVAAVRAEPVALGELRFKRLHCVPSDRLSATELKAGDVGPPLWACR